MRAKIMARVQQFTHQLRIEAHAVWLSARDPQVPLPTRILGWLVAGYALSPIDLIPDFIPIFGLLDDLLLLPLGIWLFTQLIPEDRWAVHLATAEAASHRPVSNKGAIVIVLIWLGLLALIAMQFMAMKFY
jgi:uncharacterized membrane protein YkvA (DUF1232 family)